MNVVNFASFFLIGACNLLVYSYFFKKFNANSPEYDKREAQTISGFTHFIRYFQKYYGPVALLYFALDCFYLNPHGPSLERLAVGLSVAVSGLLLQIWSLSHIRQQFSPCHDAKLPEERIYTGPYQYVQHPIYLANFLQFVAIAIANPRLFFFAALGLQLFFYSMAIRDENRALGKKFSDNGYRFWNAPLVGLALGSMLFVNFFMPSMIHSNGMINVALIVVFAMASNSIWALIHEGIHGKLFYERSHSDFWSRLLSIAFGTNFTPVMIGHLCHHQFSRNSEERFEVYQGKASVQKHFGYYAIILGGLYVGEVVLPLLALLPQRVLKHMETVFARNSISWHLLKRFNAKNVNVRRTRIDLLLTILYFAVSITLWWSNIQYLILFYAFRAFLISFFDYPYHYATKLNDPKFAKDLRLPVVLQASFLNFNLHGIHHVHPDRPWYQMPKFLKEKNGLQFDGEFFSHSLLQLKGPIEQGDLPHE